MCCYKRPILLKLRRRILFDWPYEKSLQSAILQSLRSAEHAYSLGRGSFGTQNLIVCVTNHTESDGHVSNLSHAVFGNLQFSWTLHSPEFQDTNLGDALKGSIPEAVERSVLQAICTPSCQWQHAKFRQAAMCA